MAHGPAELDPRVHAINVPPTAPASSPSATILPTNPVRLVEGAEPREAIELLAEPWGATRDP